MRRSPEGKFSRRLCIHKLQSLLEALQYKGINDSLAGILPQQLFDYDLQLGNKHGLRWLNGLVWEAMMSSRVVVATVTNLQLAQHYPARSQTCGDRAMRFECDQRP